MQRADNDFGWQQWFTARIIALAHKLDEFIHCLEL